jgi:hypothetical protein
LAKEVLSFPGREVWNLQSKDGFYALREAIAAVEF